MFNPCHAGTGIIRVLNVTGRIDPLIILGQESYLLGKFNSTSPGRGFLIGNSSVTRVKYYVFTKLANRIRMNKCFDFNMAALVAILIFD